MPRLAPLALQALKVAGYGEVAYAYKVAEGGIAAVILTPTFRVFVERVVPMLQRHLRTAGATTDYKTKGAAEAELALRLYYLACGQAVDRLKACGASLESSGRGEPGDPADAAPAARDAASPGGLKVESGRVESEGVRRVFFDRVRATDACHGDAPVW